VLVALQYACARARQELWLARGPTERTATTCSRQGDRVVGATVCLCASAPWALAGPPT